MNKRMSIFILSSPSCEGKDNSKTPPVVLVNMLSVLSDVIAKMNVNPIVSERIVVHSPLIPIPLAMR